MNKPIDQFQALLRELFQFDCSDLDFGIYRIMNHKREVIERFITNDLPKAVSEVLESGALADQAQAANELEEVAQQIKSTLASDAIDADGNLVAFQTSEIGKKYQDLQIKAAGIGGRDAPEGVIFNHLFAFFSRYYQDGDFISKRRYSKRQRYAIPYNGEEVHLHWANNDQYYVKTGEYFRDYSFVVRGITVHFRLQAADVEQENVEGDKRFFLPCAELLAWDKEASRLDIPFEYRPLTSQEEITYGKKNQQEAIISEASAAIGGQLKKTPDALAALVAERRKNSDGEAVSFLEHHLVQYTRRNTSDFFIHKDLRGLLSHELDFYLKNEVLNLDEVETAGEDRAEGWFQIMRTIRSVGGQIIEFLSQIENFQKMLWEKRKFVTETHYCITMGNIADGFYVDIARCEAQWDEWKELFSIDEDQTDLFNAGKDKTGKRVEFLKLRPTLVLDTRHFDQGYVDLLLGSFDDLDGATDGVLIHGENFHALQLLSEGYRGQLKCVHIDPPYNTQASGFLYKNEYQHSSWLAMMQDRILASIPLLRREGALLCHIDENEYEVLHLLFANTGLPDGGTIVWDKKNPMLGRKGIATQHEYILWRSWSESPVYLRPANVRMMLEKVGSLIRKYGSVNEEVRHVFRDWVNRCGNLTGGERAYQHIDEDGRIFQSVGMSWPNPKKPPAKFFVPLFHPVTQKPCPVPSRGWSRTPEKMQELLDRGEIIFGKDERVQPRRKVFLKPDSGRQLSSVLSDAGRGKNDIEKLGLEFPYCHPVSLYEELIGAAVPNSGDIILDHFAGSGTTGHAVMNLNREDGGHRRFILVEMGEYFDTVLLPRIKKVAFTPEWKNGKPEPIETPDEARRNPCIFKYMRLESYEDVLNNIDFEGDTTQQALQFDDYLLKYMLHWETRRSATLLNLEKLSQPFHYTLNIHSEGQTRQQIADVPETFNYLIGLRVDTRRVYDDHGRRYLVYRGRIDQRQVAVIWRENQGWDKAALVRDKEFVAEQKLTEGADEVYVNGDSFIREARALESVFKRRMFAETGE